MFRYLAVVVDYEGVTPSFYFNDLALMAECAVFAAEIKLELDKAHKDGLFHAGPAWIQFCQERDAKWGALINEAISWYDASIENFNWKTVQFESLSTIDLLESSKTGKTVWVKIDDIQEAY